jgi:hypothetical protein
MSEKVKTMIDIMFAILLMFGFAFATVLVSFFINFINVYCEKRVLQALRQIEEHRSEKQNDNS